MLFTEVIAVHNEKHEKSKNTKCRAELLIIEADETYIYHVALKRSLGSSVRIVSDY
jgi:hypothetical protein